MTNDPLDDEQEQPRADDGILLEESSHEDEGAEDEGSSGLELDAQQTAEIRQIFLTTLPDYLEPMREMVAKLSSEPDDSGEIRRTLAKTIASIVEAASRVKLGDVAHTLEGLREDVMLIGDGDEPQAPLHERIAKVFDALGALAGASKAGTPKAATPGEGARGRATIVSASREIERIDASALQKLVAAGLAYVDQVLEADPKDVAMVSGLSVDTVARIAGALKGEPAPASAEADVVGDAIRGVVDDEMSLDEMRGEALRLRVAIQTLRTQIGSLETECGAIRADVADARERAATRVKVLAEAESRRATLEREHRTTEAELQRVAARLAALQSERCDAMEELGRLAGDTASLSEQITKLLDD